MCNIRRNFYSCLIHRLRKKWVTDNLPLSHGKSRLVGKPAMWFPTRSDTNRPVQSQKMARSLKFWSKVEEELYYPSSENKGADQLRVTLFLHMQIVGFPVI